MDNITHSLFGAAVSETFWTFLPEKTKAEAAPKTRRALLLASVAGNNLPDFDFLYAPFMHVNPQMGSLLHHRGHTHTVPIAFLQSLLMLGICFILQRWVKRFDFKKEWKWISLLAFLAPLTHIALDYLNNFGVHPFWPLDNSWKYGDWVFVLEPWAWATLTPFLFFLASSKWEKFSYAMIAALGLALSWSLGVVPLLMCAILTAWFVLLFITFFFLKNTVRAAGTWGALLLMLVIFEIGHRTTLTFVKKEVESNFPFQMKDIILSPLPVNPLCWAVITVESDATNLRLKRAIVSPFPELASLKTCTRLRFFASGVAEATLNSQILWEKDHLISLNELKELKQQFCDVKDFLQFARAPYFWKDESGLYFSDLRFERSKRKSFARMKISSRTPPCLPSRAPWSDPVSLPN